MTISPEIDLLDLPRFRYESLEDPAIFAEYFEYIYIPCYLFSYQAQVYEMCE